LERARVIVDVLEVVPYVRTISFGEPPYGSSLESGFWKSRGLSGGQFVVGAGMFATLGTPMVAGREFSWEDLAGSPDVVMLNHAGLRALWPEARTSAAIGRSVDVNGRRRTIIGVTGDIRSTPGAPVVPTLFLPFADDTNMGQTALPLVVRMMPGQVPDVQLVVSRLNEVFPPNGATVSAVALQVAPVIARPRFLAVLFGTLAAMAIIVAVIGVHAVASLETVRRRRELAIRLALGATRARLYTLVIGGILRPVLVGVAVGIVAAWVTVTAVPWSVVELSYGFGRGAILAALCMIGAAVSAVWLLARRAISVSPATFGR
jgi:hypothetical protein